MVADISCGTQDLLIDGSAALQAASGRYFQTAGKRILRPNRLSPKSPRRMRRISMSRSGPRERRSKGRGAGCAPPSAGICSSNWPK